MALKALDQRLANPAQNPGASSPLPHSASSHHPTPPAHELPNSHSHPPHTPPQTVGPPAATLQAKPTGSNLPLHGAKASSGASRGEGSEGETDITVVAEKTGMLPT